MVKSSEPEDVLVKAAIVATALLAVFVGAAFFAMLTQQVRS